MLASPHSLVPWLALVMLCACAASPVDWTENGAIRFDGRPIALAADGTIRPDSVQLRAHTPAPSPVCAGSVQVARSRSKLFAAWWAPRADSGALLMASRSDDEGASWQAAVAVDTTDRSVAGCGRTPPAIAADSVSGYVHVTYALRAREGPGLFFSHSMDGGITFHSPVPILYGERLGRTSVAADGDRVAVAFEDPSSAAPRVGLALSRTMGHLFEQRILPVSDDHGAASHPLVAVSGNRIAVAWREGADSAAGITLRTRRGTIH